MPGRGGGALFPAYSPLSTHPPRSELESGWVSAVDFRRTNDSTTPWRLGAGARHPMDGQISVRMSRPCTV